MLVGLQSNIRTKAITAEDFAAVLRAHHFILAIGNLAKGFPDLSGKSPVAIGEWVGVFKEGTEVVLGVAKSMGSFVIIRDAVSFIFFEIRERNMLRKIVARLGSLSIELLLLLEKLSYH